MVIVFWALLMAFPVQPLVVENLPYHLKWQEIRDIFKKAGEVKCIHLLKTPNGKSMGVAYLWYKDPCATEKAIKVYNDKVINGHQILVRKVTEKDRQELNSQKYHEEKFTYPVRAMPELVLDSSGLIFLGIGICLGCLLSLNISSWPGKVVDSGRQNIKLDPVSPKKQRKKKRAKKTAVFPSNGHLNSVEKIKFLVVLLELIKINRSVRGISLKNIRRLLIKQKYITAEASLHWIRKLVFYGIQKGKIKRRPHTA